ncbi:MAG: sialate O-acetylesterase [Chitinophagaceae bacterium]|nr:sialate O-acetylesterase [Chitinophagaceae bacterium]
MRKIVSTIYFATLLFSIPVFANVQLASPFGDHMVLQRNIKIPVWGIADAGENITIVFNNQTVKTITDKDGNWKINLAKLPAGGPYKMTVTGKNTITISDVYVGEVWICSGQSNMDMTVAKEDRYWCGVINEAEEVAAANYPTIRVFDVDFTPNENLQNKVTGKWEIVSPQTVGHLSAAAYFFARDIQKRLKIPIGLITTAYGASTAEAWIRKEALQQNATVNYLVDSFQARLNRYYADIEAPQKYEAALAKFREEAAKARAEGKTPGRGPRNPNPAVDQHNPYVLWNGMVAPLVPYGIRGALWYQGESNGPTATIYKDIMEILISDWRKQWGMGNFPFIYVQLANHQKAVTEPVKNDPMVTVRDAQLQNLSIPNTAMVVAIDNADPGDPGNIHPKNKQEIGRRLALAALGLVYGEKIVYSGPVFEKMTVEGNKIRLHFKNAGNGLEVKGDTLYGFAIAGPDKNFTWADARIDGNSVVIYSATISNPVAVRYGWAKNSSANLFNKAGLPASPFKTD